METFRLCAAEAESVNLDLTKEENINIERNFIINHLRMWGNHFDIREREIHIPDDCEKYGFVDGKHNIGQMMRFFADMLEE